MGFGGGGNKNPPVPTPEPVVPVPQEDDAGSLETKREATASAKQREGYSSHLLAGGKFEGARGDTIQGQSKPKKQSSLLS